MRIDLAKLRELAAKRGLSLAALLEGGVSRTFTIDTARPSRSLGALADTLSVRPGVFLTEENPDIAKIRRILDLTDRIVADDRDLDRDNVRLTLLVLEEKPIQRLRRSLIRGRKIDLHR
jgi:hypothetical protein